MKNKLLLIILLLAFLANSESSLAQTTTLAAWDFNSSSTTASSFNSNNNGKQLTSSQSIGWNADDNSGESASADGWNGGGGSDYWQIEVNTTGFESIKVSSWQKGSNSGPANFKLQYRIGSSGNFIDVTGATISMTNSNWAAYGRLTDASIPAEANNTSVVFIRWLMVNNTSIGGSSVQSGGNSRIDDIVVTGVTACALPSTPTGTIATVGSAPFCGTSISFTRNGGSAAPSGIVFYWQTAAAGEDTTFPLTSNPTFTISGAGTRTAYLRARRTTGGCWSANTISASGTVYALPGISLHPINRIVGLNSNTTFTATATGTITSRQWQVSTDNGASWQNLSNTTPYSGTTTATLSITGVGASLHENLYRMVANNSSCNTITNAASLIITGTPIITAQPVLSYDFCNGAKIEMAAANTLGSQNNLTYNWFVFTPGTNDWTAIANDGHYSGAATNTLYINSLVGLNRSQYYVQVRYKNQNCYTASSTVGVVFNTVPSRWDGSGWSNGIPTSSTVVVLDADYDTSTGNLMACSIDLNNNTITINGNQFVQVENTISGTGTIDIKNNGSLVQKLDNTDNGKQWTTKMERITQKMSLYDFTYWSSPVTGTTLHDLSPDTTSDKYFWWNAGTVSGNIGWNTSVGGIEEMVPGKGYGIRAPNKEPYGMDTSLPSSFHPFTGNFIGKANNGLIRYNVAGGTEVYNLLGNPYPSAIDADKFIADNIANGALNGTLYFWTHNTPMQEGEYSASDYAAYTMAGGVGTKKAPSDADSANDNTPKGQIAAGQAFFVEGNATTGTVVFSNSMRIAGSNNQFFRPGPTEPIQDWDTTGKHRVWLNLNNSGTGFNQILLGYMPYATNGNDIGYDGKSFSGNAVTLYSINENENLTIQARAMPFNNQDQIPLGYITTQSGTLTISIDHYEGLFQAQHVYLEDKVLNIVHNLKESAYSFTSATGTFNTRFVVKYTNTTLGEDEHEAMANGVLVYANDGGIIIKSELENLEEVIVYDLLGRKVSDKTGIGQHEWNIQNVVMNEQALIVKVVLENGITVSKKIIY